MHNSSAHTRPVLFRFLTYSAISFSLEISSKLEVAIYMRVAWTIKRSQSKLELIARPPFEMGRRCSVSRHQDLSGTDSHCAAVRCVCCAVRVEAAAVPFSPTIDSLYRQTTSGLAVARASLFLPPPPPRRFSFSSLPLRVSPHRTRAPARAPSPSSPLGFRAAKSQSARRSLLSAPSSPVVHYSRAYTRCEALR